MAKKAKLDLMDISVDARPEKVEESIKDESVHDQGGTSNVKRIAGGVSWIRAFARKPVFWIILISMVLVGSIGAISVSIYYRKAIPSPPIPRDQPTLEASIPSKDKIALLGGFVVDLNDEKGNVRIAFCDIAIEMENPQIADAVISRIDARKAIYTVLKKRKAEEFLLPAAKGVIKIECKEELNRLLGEHSVIQVYVTRFEVI